MGGEDNYFYFPTNLAEPFMNSPSHPQIYWQSFLLLLRIFPPRISPGYEEALGHFQASFDSALLPAQEGESLLAGPLRDPSPSSLLTAPHHFSFPAPLVSLLPVPEVDLSVSMDSPELSSPALSLFFNGWWLQQSPPPSPLDAQLPLLLRTQYCLLSPPCKQLA